METLTHAMKTRIPIYRQYWSDDKIAVSEKFTITRHPFTAAKHETGWEGTSSRYRHEDGLCKFLGAREIKQVIKFKNDWPELFVVSFIINRILSCPVVTCFLCASRPGRALIYGAFSRLCICLFVFCVCVWQAYLINEATERSEAVDGSFESLSTIVGPNTGLSGSDQ